jgi:hypothetical protein
MTTISSSNAYDFGLSVNLYEHIPLGEYERITFTPHGSFDIFAGGLTNERIYSELKRLINERKEVEQKVPNLTVRSRKLEILKKACFLLSYESNLQYFL